MKRAHIILSGIVQGVSYRRFTENNAIKLGLKGYVRNLPDGRVEVMAEGSESSISKLVAALRKGPPEAKVADIKVTWYESENEFKNFERRH